MKLDCGHKNLFNNSKSYSNHQRWCLGLMYQSKNWKGSEVGYKGLHLWIRKHLEKPKFCKKCNLAEPKEVANLDGKYTRDLKTWKWLCVRCHRFLDGHVARFIKLRPTFNLKGIHLGKKLSSETKLKISLKSKAFEKFRKRDSFGRYIHAT